MPPIPISPAPRSPEKLMMLIFSCLILPFLWSARMPAAMPTVEAPPAPSCVYIHGTIHGVVMYDVLATYMQPVAPVTIVRGAPAPMKTPLVVAARAHQPARRGG